MNKFSPSVTTTEYEVLGEDAIRVKVQFRDGRVYVITFVSPSFVKRELKSNGIGCVIVPALLVLDKVNMDRVKEVFHDILHSGFFDSLKPVENDGE